MRDEAEGPHREAEAGHAEHHQPSRIEFARQNDIDWGADQRSDSGRKYRRTGLPRAEAADVSQEQRREVDRGEDTDAGHERQQAPQREVTIAERSQIDDRMTIGQA